MCRILLADDHAIFRAGLRSLLELDAEYKVISEASDGQQAYIATLELQPDLVVIDLSMPNSNGTEAVNNIKRRCPQVKLLVLTAHKEEEYVRVTLAAGADGYAIKDDTHEELLIAIRSVLRGDRYVSPSVSKQVIEGYLNQTTPRTVAEPSWHVLTKREREVLKLVAEGKKNKEIAGYLSLSPKTIEKHRANLMNKLKFKNTSALIFYAIENGLVTT